MISDDTKHSIHLLTLIVLDVVIILVVGFFNNFILWMVFKAAGTSFVLPKFYSIISTMLIWIAATLPFYTKHQSLIKSPITDNRK